MEMISKTIQYHCNVCFRDWGGNPDNPDPTECPFCEEDRKSGYNDVITAVNETIDQHFTQLVRYVRESAEALKDELSGDIRRNLNKKHK